MPWIPFYADENDFQLIKDKLNSDAEIAFIISSGNGKWIARNELVELVDGKYCLWHIPSGSLPLLSKTPLGKNIMVKDPFAGWRQRRAGADPSVPFFGSIPGIIVLHKVTNGVEFSGSIGLSTFGWIGNRYRTIGYGATKATEYWWRRMRLWVKKVAIEKIPRWDSSDALEPEIWAFPAAFEKIKAGTFRDTNPPA